MHSIYFRLKRKNLPVPFFASVKLIHCGIPTLEKFLALLACLQIVFQQWNYSIWIFKKASWKLFFFFRKYRNFFTNWKENLTAFKRHLVRHFRKASTRLSLCEKRRKIHLLSEVSITKFCMEQKSLILNALDVSFDRTYLAKV